MISLSTAVVILILSSSQGQAFPPPTTALLFQHPKTTYAKYHSLLQVRGGGDAVSSTATSAAINGVSSVSTVKQEIISTRQRYLKIAKELGRHVWPKVPPKQQKDYDDDAPINNTKKRRKEALTIRYRVILSMLTMLAGKASTIVTPYIFKALIDVVPTYAATSTTASTIATNNLLPISLPILLLISYGICRSISSFFREATSVIFSYVAQAAIRSVGRTTFDHVHALDLQYHLNRNTGALSRVLERGSRAISLVLNAMVFSTLPTLIEVGVVMGLLFKKFGWLHALTVLLTIVSYSAYTVFITKWRSSIRKSMIGLENKASGKVSDSLLNYETVKYFNQEMHEGDEYETTLHKYQNAQIKAARSLSALNFGQQAIFSVGLTIIMALTLRNVKAGTATVGDLVLVNGLLFQLSVPLNFIGWVYQETKQAFIDMEAVFELRDTKPQIADAENAQPYDPVRDGTSISFEELEFGYETTASVTENGASSSFPSSIPTTVATASADAIQQQHQLHEEQLVTTRPILKKTTFIIPQGKTVAIVGTSGCGKSTLLRILYRFYAPDKGSVRLGGKDITSYTTNSIRKAIAVVPQDVVLFNDSIGYNIRYGNLNASWDEVIDASKKAHLHEIIQRLPEGYNTIVGERGLKLSGGEKQRVSLARAILKKAPIMLCDEPTSSLDMQTELEIMNNLKEVGKDTTCVIIAHRLSTIQDCDEIVVMDEGRVVESGSHDELLRLGGRYSELVAFQRGANEDAFSSVVS